MKKILNVGCGNDTYGTDFLDLYPQRREVKKYNADVDKMPYKDNTFDEIISNYMFEHLRNTKLFLEECYRVLKPRGKIKLKTDNSLYFGYSFNKIHRGGYNDYGEKDLHYSLFTKEHLKNHFEAAGFKIKKIDYVPNNKVRIITKIIRFFAPRDSKHPWIEVIAEK